MILYIKHIAIEGPDTLGAYFASRGFAAQEVDLSRGERLPESLDNIEAVICLGGPMNVYQEDAYPFLRQEDVFIKKALQQELPFLGICLGSQLLAKACGAKVGKSPVKEVGWFPVTITPDGRQDPLFRNTDGPLEVFQWHEDMFQVPTQGRLLAASPGCPHQAFRVGKNAYGLQFHIEVSACAIEAWIREYWKVDDARSLARGKEMLDRPQEIKRRFDQQAKIIYNNFLSIMNS